MAVNSVHLAADVYMVCLSHALSTEKEEIMGLLIGEVSQQSEPVKNQTVTHELNVPVLGSIVQWTV